MKKVLTVILSAVLFGALAGGVILGVGALGKKLNIIEEAQAQPAVEQPAETVQPEPQAGTKAAAATESAAQVSAASKSLSSEATGNTIKRGETIKGGVTALDVSDVVEACMPEVVAITNTTVIKQQGYNSFYDYFYGNSTEREYTTQAAGSGVIIGEDDGELLIVTNKHVAEGATEIEVTFIDGESVKAQMKGFGSDMDIAVIAVSLSEVKEETKEQIKVAKLHEEDDLKPGQGVIAIGNALGYGQSVTVGVISALHRDMGVTSRSEDYSNLIQTDAAINPGNSGGALLNNEGELIGINVGKLAATEIDSVGYAIPLYSVADLILELSEAKTKVEIPEEDQGRLGIYMNTITASQSQALNMPAGVIIVGFSDEEQEGYEEYELQESPAKDAGLQKGDIITRFAGQKVSDAQELANLVKYYEAGSEVTVTVQRMKDGEYEEKEFTVVLGRKTAAAENGSTEEKTETEAETGPDNNNVPGGEGFGYEYDDVYDFFRRYLEQYR